MSTLRFYQQERYDGGLRTGVGIDSQTLLQEFRPGSEESDPALLWYVDVVLEVERLPKHAEEARSWLIKYSAAIVSSLRALSERLEIGLDNDSKWPYEARIAGLPRGIRGRIVLSAIGRLPEGVLARRLNELANEWESVLERLTALAVV